MNNLNDLYLEKGKVITDIELLQIRLQKINQEIIKSNGLNKTEKKEK